MKMKLVAVSVLGLMLTAPFAQAEAVSLKTDLDGASYAIGVDLVRNMKSKNIDINIDAFIQGIKDGMGNGKLLMTDSEMTDSLTKFQNNMRAKATAMFEKMANENRTKGQKFLEENGKMSGVTTSPSGFQYKMTKEGTGPKPSATDTVTVEYTGSTIDGKIFDSTDKSGQPATFPLNQVIPC
ncbi:MAG: FKBP-type peptidyl-prolyl cis-trans isomerase N-terminal domain-containing protein, partial [Gammaproteobacteria bacterium]